MTSRRALSHILAPLIVCTPFLVACGGGGSTNNKAIETATCSGPAGDLGAGELCADGGFRITKNDFAFPNWVGVEGTTDKPDAGLMVTLFGLEAVCSSGTSASDCVLNPSAQSTLEQWTEALDGGHCEGMATLSMRYYLGLQKPSDTEPGATTAALIKRPEKSVDQEINMWWATQFMPEVRAAAAASRKQSPIAIVNELIAGLKSGAGYTLGIYSDGYGHAVTPFAVTKQETTYLVHIYDNNFPGVKKFISVDEKTKEWEYTDGTENTDGTPYTWKGGTGTFELTPMDVRKGPFTEEFGAVVEGVKGSTVVEMSTKGAMKGFVRQPAAGLLVTTASGKRIGVSNGSLVNEIPGASYTIGKGGLGTSLILVEVPDGEEFTVDPQPATTQSAPQDRDITLAVTTTNGSRTEVRTKRQLVNNASPSKEITINAQREVTLRPQNKVEVSVTNNKGRVNVQVPANGQLTAKPGKDAQSELEVTGTDASGKQVLNQALPPAKARSQATPMKPSGAAGSSIAPAGEPRATSIPPNVTGSSVPTSIRSTSTVPRSSTTVARTGTTTTVARSSSTSSSVARTGTTTTVARSSTSTTVARSSSTSSTVASSSSTSSTVARSSSTSSTVASSSSTAVSAGTASTTSSVPRSSTTSSQP